MITNTSMFWALGLGLWALVSCLLSLIAFVAKARASHRMSDCCTRSRHASGPSKTTWEPKVELQYDDCDDFGQDRLKQSFGLLSTLAVSDGF